jgi:hypothetical protein
MLQRHVRFPVVARKILFGTSRAIGTTASSKERPRRFKRPRRINVAGKARRRSNRDGRSRRSSTWCNRGNNDGSIGARAYGLRRERTTRVKPRRVVGRTCLILLRARSIFHNNLWRIITRRRLKMRRGQRSRCISKLNGKMMELIGHLFGLSTKLY